MGAVQAWQSISMEDTQFHVSSKWSYYSTWILAIFIHSCTDYSPPANTDLKLCWTSYPITKCTTCSKLTINVFLLTYLSISTWIRTQWCWNVGLFELKCSSVLFSSEFCRFICCLWLNVVIDHKEFDTKYQINYIINFSSRQVCEGSHTVQCCRHLQVHTALLLSCTDLLLLLLLLLCRCVDRFIGRAPAWWCLLHLWPTAEVLTAF